MNRENTNKEDNRQMFAACLKIFIVFLFLTVMISISQARLEKKIEYNYQQTISLVTNENYSLVVDGFFVDSDAFAIQSDWKYAYKVVEINDETKTIYLKKRLM